MQLLIVDDNFDVRRMVRALLMASGYEVREAETGLDAWNLLQTEPIPLLIVDWMMPHMTGPELIQRIRQAPLPHYTYLLMLTAKGSDEDMVAGLEAGADDYLTKPFNPHELRARVGIGRRIIELEQRLRAARDEMARQARQDSLTGLYNRHAILQIAEQLLGRTRAQHQPFSLILLDVDHFKQINDTYGHLKGDQALQHVARTLTRALRPGDEVGRWGGEEFLILLPNTPTGEAEAFAERLRTSIAATPMHEAGLSPFSVTVSQGLATARPSDALSVEELFHKIDQALYQAKADGRNRVSTMLDVS